MLASNIPAKFAEPFAKNATASYIRTIPTTSGDPTVASLDLGFPPATATPVGAGGVPPNIADINGILNQISAWSQWLAAGGAFPPYDSTFQTTIGGYPQGAVVASVATPGAFWLSTADNNVTNPDTGGAGWVQIARLRLTANTSFYVSPTGSDSNPGTIGSPWLTIQHAINVLSNSSDLAGFTATIQLADGTYTGANSIAAPFTGGGAVVISGNVGTPANVLLNVVGIGLMAAGCANISIKNLKIQTSGGVGSHCLQSASGAIINFSNIIFGSCTGAHLYASDGQIYGSGPYSIVGGATDHIFCSYSGSVINIVNCAVTLSGTLNFSDAFASSSNNASVVTGGATFTGGTVTGVRALVSVNGSVNTGGIGATQFPGNSTTAPATGGQLV